MTDEVKLHSRHKKWSQERRGLFLDGLAATCCVRQAAAAAEMTESFMYKRRRDDAVFAAEWRAALDAGYDRIEAALIRKALAVLGEAAETIDRGDFAIEDALRLLANHRSQQRRPPETRRRAIRRATEAETDKAILKQLAALDRRLKAKRADHE